MRVFVAIVPPNKTQDDLQKTQDQLARFLTSGKLVPKSNFHITLAFLGEVAQSDLIFVQSAMDVLCGFGGFEMSAKDVYSLRSANIVCAKYKTNAKLVELHSKLSEELQKMGFSVQSTRVFKPHTTLFRNCKFSMPFSEVAKNADIYNRPFEVGQIVLMQSILETEGVRYEEIYKVELCEVN